MNVTGNAHLHQYRNKKKRNFCISLLDKSCVMGHNVQYLDKLKESRLQFKKKKMNNGIFAIETLIKICYILGREN